MAWNDLSMAHKAKIMDLAIKQGIKDLRNIVSVYEYADGGQIKPEGFVGPPAPYIPSESIKNYIKGAEAFRSDWYKDANGNDTVGYGFTGQKVKELYPNGMTRQQADAYFDTLTSKFAKRMIQLTPNAERLSQNQLDALFSYFYNIGEGTYSTKSPKMQQALKDFDLEAVMQNIDAGYNDKKNPGLRKRRDYERALFEQDIPRPLGPIPPAINREVFYNPQIEQFNTQIPFANGDVELVNPFMYKSGGKIYIKPSHRGKFTALKKRTGKSASWFKAHGTPAQRKMATFALNARKWKHGDGGLLTNTDDFSF